MIIAFGHRKQQGKDTAAWYFSTFPGMESCVIRSLAGKLYQICEILVPDFRTKEFYDQHPKLKELPLANGMSPRHILLRVGQKMKEVLGKDCWVAPLVEMSRDLEETHVLVPDLRYKEEAEMLKRNGAICVKVIRPGIDVSNDVADDDLADWNGWDYVIYNSSTLEAFRMECFNLWEKIQRSREESNNEQRIN